MAIIEGFYVPFIEGKSPRRSRNASTTVSSKALYENDDGDELVSGPARAWYITNEDWNGLTSFTISLDFIQKSHDPWPPAGVALMRIYSGAGVLSLTAGSAGSLLFDIITSEGDNFSLSDDGAFTFDEPHHVMIAVDFGASPMIKAWIDGVDISAPDFAGTPTAVLSYGGVLDRVAGGYGYGGAQILGLTTRRRAIWFSQVGTLADALNAMDDPLATSLGTPTHYFSLNETLEDTGTSPYTQFYEDITENIVYVDWIEGDVAENSLVTSSVSDTEIIDPFRQGIEITTDRQRYIGTLPKFGTGDKDHQLSVVVYGQSNEFREDVTFEEIIKFDPVLYVQTQDSLIFPIVRHCNDNETDIRCTIAMPFTNGETNGSIEPLSIGARSILLSCCYVSGAMLVREPHQIRAHIQRGNEDFFGKVDDVEQEFILNDDGQARDLYIDSSDNIGDSSGSVSLPRLDLEFPEKENLIAPYDETRVLFRCMTKTVFEQISGSIKYAVLAMTGSSTDEYIPLGIESLGTGFTYDSSIRGTDSLAFGGRKRS